MGREERDATRRQFSIHLLQWPRRFCQRRGIVSTIAWPRLVEPSSEQRGMREWLEDRGGKEREEYPILM